MGEISNYYLNTNTFGSATSVYLDEGLTTLAPDGFYAIGGIVREQVGGVLQDIEPCISCTNSCPAAPPGTGWNVSNYPTGVFDFNILLGTGTGAVAITVDFLAAPAQVGPTGFRAIYNNEVYNTCFSSYDGRHEAASINSPIFIGDGSTACAQNLVANSPYPGIPELEYQQPLFNALGTETCVTVLEENVSFTDPYPVAGAQYVFIVPKEDPLPANIFFTAYRPDPCCSSALIRVECPVKLPSFQTTKKNAPCGTLPTITLYYYSLNAPFPAVNDVIFTTSNGSEHPPNGQYIWDDGAAGQVLNIQDGIIASIASCPAWVGLLDIAPPATGAWSTRRLSISGLGRIMTVRRDTAGGVGQNDTAQVFYDPATNFIGLGSPVTTSTSSTTLEEFVGGGGNPDGVNFANVTLYVEEWADQSGSGNHLTTLDPSLQPIIYQFPGGIAGFIYVNSQPAVWFENNAKMGPIDFNYPQPYTFSFVGKYDDTTTVAQSNFFGSRTATSGTNDIVGFALRSNQWDMIAPFNGFSGTVDTDQHNWVMVFDGVEFQLGGAFGELIPSGSYLRTDTVQETTNPGEIEIKNLSMGAFGVENSSTESRYIQELVFWNGDQTDAVPDIENNTNSDFNIY